MHRVPIRLKLAAALFVPLFALGVVTMLEVVRSSRDASRVREQTDLADAATGPAGLLTALQNERTWPGVDLVGLGGQVTVPVEGYDRTRADTDSAVTAFRTRVESSGGAIEAAYGPALDQLDQLGTLRDDIDAHVAANPERSLSASGFAEEVSERYTALIVPFFDATTRIALSVDDAELRQGTELADLAARQIETITQLGNSVFRHATASDGSGLDTAAEIGEVATLRGSFVRNAETMRNATGPYADVAASSFPAELTDDITTAVDAAILDGTVDFGLLVGALEAPEEASYVAYQEAVSEQIASRSDELQTAADQRRLWFAALAALALGTAVTLTWLVSRSITRPLRSLTRQAKEMAERRLPDAVIDILETPLGDDVAVPRVDPVVVRTRDEVADVAVALNIVQDTALDLAVEQAVLRRNIADSFVNLGRRNQNLLGRQLDFITELESHESDPDTLANLFRLDHLATRMRRNAESLLVLAGIAPPRQWAAPVRLTDVIRAALGEVEDYQRVTVRGVEPATILGSAAADLAHILAELIENALVFSPPDQTVDIRGRNRPDGYALAVIDSGLGIPTHDITAANRRLAGAESFTVAPSRYLGHYVAGNLAHRHGIHVRLDNSPGNGVTATLDLPPTLLTSDAALAPTEETHAARDVWPPAATLGDSGGATAAPPGPTSAGRGHEPSHPDRGGQPTGRPVGAPAAGQGGGPAGDDRPPGLPAPPPIGAGTPDRRTPGGLVKRTPRFVDTGEVRAVSQTPDDDLLAALSRHTRPTPDPRRAPAPPAQPTPAGEPAPPSGPSLPGQPPQGVPQPPDGPAGPTGGGLARRVRGAQMPTTNPLVVRRSSSHGSAHPTAAPTPPALSPEQKRSADAVYGFLTDFSAGVRRGLGESGHPPT